MSLQFYNGEYHMDGIPCKRIVNTCIAKGVAHKHGVEHTDPPNPITLPTDMPRHSKEFINFKAKEAGMTTADYLAMRQKNRERTRGIK